MLFLSVRPTLFLVQSRSLSGRHVSTGFLDPVLGAMMKQVCWHSRRSKAYRGLPEARMAGATAFEDVNMWQAPETTPYGNLECGRAKSGRRDLMGSQRVARPSLERGMEAASGKKRTPRHEGVTEGRGGNGRKPPPPHTMCHTPHWASAGRVASYYFVFLKRRKCIRGHFLGVFGIRSGPSQGFSRIRRGHPQASARALADMWIKMAAFPDLALRRCCLGW